MIVVTGATGNVGRELVQTLIASGTEVIAVSRNIADAALPERVHARPADLADPETLPQAFDGATALFLMLSGAGAQQTDVTAVLQVAKASGVERVVLLSSQGVLTRPNSPTHGILMRTIEQAVEQSGIDWTILRPGGFASNAYAWAETIRAQRAVYAPFGDVGLPVIDPADIAAVAAAALQQDGHAGNAYLLSGPALVTPRQRAAAISEALSEPIQFIEIDRQQALEQMTQFMPESIADTTLNILGQLTPDEQQISPDVHGILGRPENTFADWIKRNIATFK